MNYEFRDIWLWGGRDPFGNYGNEIMENPMEGNCENEIVSKRQQENHGLV